MAPVEFYVPGVGRVIDGDDIAGFTVSRLAVDDVMLQANVRVFEPLWRRPAEVDRVLTELDDKRDDLVRERLTGDRYPFERIWDEGLLAAIDGDLWQ